MIQLVINIDSRGAEVIRCDGLIPVKKLVEYCKEHLGDPRLGVITRTAALSDIIKAVTEAAEEATTTKEK